jgi:DNA polymerase-1
MCMRYNRVWFADFEFGSRPGALPEPRCLVMIEYRTGRKVRLWLDNSKPSPPFKWKEDDLFVAYYASAEIGCFFQLGWPLPPNILDLFAEFRSLHNGFKLTNGNGLLGALTRYGLSHIESTEKDSMRELALRGGPYSLQEQEALLEYCQQDVEALEPLFEVMVKEIDIPLALIRGRYMAAVAWMERVGVPIDVETFQLLRDELKGSLGKIIAEVDQNYGVYEGSTFKTDKFEQYLAREKIPWPRTEKGQLALNDKVFRQMARKHPQLSALRELRHTLGQTRLMDLEVGPDGRNRCLLSPFRSKTSRNQPSNTKFIFGSSVWLRGLIKPKPEWGVAYIDYSQQEFGIAAALSQDEKMMEAYHSGDPYMSFAKLAGAVPADATKKSHPAERSLYKATVLAVQYGMGAESLAENIQKPLEEAKYLLKMHRQTFKRFWWWSDATVEYVRLHKTIWTTFGWMFHLEDYPNARSLANFPMQANGAEMLRTACVLMMEHGIRICAPVHDAVLIEAPLEELDQVVEQAQQLMGEASRIVLDGFELKTDVDLIHYPDRYCDEDRGKEFWDYVMAAIKPET